MSAPLLCPTHGCRLHYVDHGSPQICPQCRASIASAERIAAAQSTEARVDSILGFGWRPRRDVQAAA